MTQVFHVDSVFTGDAFLSQSTITVTDGVITSIQAGFEGEGQHLMGLLVPGFY